MSGFDPSPDRHLGMEKLSAALDRLATRLGPDARARLAASRARIAAGAHPPEEAAPCRSCTGAGVVYAHGWDPALDPPPALIPCPACTAGRKAQERAAAAIIGGSGLEDLLGRTFAATAPSEDQAGHFVFARRWIEDPAGWLWLHGVPNSGKSLLAICIGNAWLASGRRVLFREEPTMFDQLRSAMRFPRLVRDGGGAGPSVEEQLEAIKTAPLLIVDDFGMARAVADAEGGSFVDEKRFTITAYRLQRSLPTVVTTNLSQSALLRRFPRLAAHVLDAPECLMVEMNVPYRAQPGLGLSEEAPS